MAGSKDNGSRRSTRPYQLTAVDLRAAKLDAELHDGGGLSARIGPNGPVWKFRYTSPVTRARRETGLGAVSLKAAREAADALRARVKAGGDPLLEADRAAEADKAAEAERARQTARNAATLRASARTYHASIVRDFRNRKHGKQWLASIEGCLPDKLLDKPIGDISADELLDVLLPLAERVPETASRVRQRLDVILDDAILRGLAERNPAAVIKRRMRGKKRAEHFRMLPFAEVPALVAALRTSDKNSMHVRLAAVFAIACAARSGEVRGATWGEIDRQRALWIVPASRMKGGAEHRVHLSAFALSILNEAESLRDPKRGEAALVFPAPRDAGRKLSDMSMTQALRRLPTGHTREDGEPETYSDLTVLHSAARATFSTWANESARARPDVIEACLAHKEADAVRRAYNRAAFEKERAALLDRWGAFISRPQHAAQKIVPLRPANS